MFMFHTCVHTHIHHSKMEVLNGYKVVMIQITHLYIVVTVFPFPSYVKEDKKENPISKQTGRSRISQEHIFLKPHT